MPGTIISGTHRLQANGVFSSLPIKTVHWTEHNSREAYEPPQGSVIAIECSDGACEHAIYVGTDNRWIIHYAGTFTDMQIRVGTLPLFIRRDGIYYVSSDIGDKPEVVITRALLNLGRENYDTFLENSALFTSFCLQGEPSLNERPSSSINMPIVLYGWMHHALFNYLDFLDVNGDGDGATLVKKTSEWMSLPRPMIWPYFAGKTTTVPVNDWDFYLSVDKSLYCSSDQFAQISSSWYD